MAYAERQGTCPLVPTLTAASAAALAATTPEACLQACSAAAGCSAPSLWRKGKERTTYMGVTSSCWLAANCSIRSSLCCTEGFATFFAGVPTLPAPRKQSIERALHLARRQYALVPESPAWHADACPFEETRHNCFFFSQPDAAQVAERAAIIGWQPPVTSFGRASPHTSPRGREHHNASTSAWLRALRGRTVAFVGDSVLRQLAEALMCRLRHFTLSERGLEWNDPSHRRVAALDYRGMCPQGARNCELRSGCVRFGVSVGAHEAKARTRAASSEGEQSWEHPSDAQPLAVCSFFGTRYSAHGGWRVLGGVLETLPPNASSLVFAVGHHLTITMLEDGWGDAPAREAVLALAHWRGVALILQEYESQHFPDGGDYNNTRHHGRASIHELNVRLAAGAARMDMCEPLPATFVSPKRELEQRLIIPYLRARGHAVLDTAAMSHAAWWAHTHAAPTPSGATDCTHFCMPGLPDVWTSVLMRTLLSSAAAH